MRDIKYWTAQIVWGGLDFSVHETALTAAQK